jgi:exosome complex RNA-binding protein Rrp42 (RNase PH superfamily)
MANKADVAVSTNEKLFVFESLAHGLRLDGRGLLDVRKTKFSFTRSANRASAEVQLGRTRFVVSYLLELHYHI